MSKDPLEMSDLVEFVESRNPSGNPMEQLTEAVLLADRFASMADDLVGHFVEAARTAGASWAEIGASIGVSKQAAQKRFVETGVKGRSRKGLFTRFAIEARAVVIATQEIARDRGEDHIGTDHLLLALLQDKSSPAAKALAGFDVTRQRVLEAMTPVGEPAPRQGHIPFSTDAKKVLELSLREAIRGNARSIGTEHILLAILRAAGSSGCRILNGLAVSYDDVDSWLDEAAA